jgi:precorrin-6B methylase 2
VNRRLRSLLAPLVPVRLALAWILFWKGQRSGLARRWGWARSLRDKTALDEDGAPIPWMPYAAISLLAERLTRDHTVLELGAGSSTLFFQARAGRVVSIEHDPDWLDWTRARAAGHVEVVAVPRDPAEVYCAAISGRGERFDLIVVDGVHRNQAFAAGLERLGPRGVILLDDSQRRAYGPALAAGAAAGFRHLHLEGHKPMSVHLHRATLFYRDGNCLGI